MCGTRQSLPFSAQPRQEFAPDCIDPQLHALELKCSPDLVIHLPHLFVKLHDPGGDHRQTDYDQHDAAKDGACGGSDDGGGTVAAYMAERDIDTIDAGVPVLSMHAPFETVGKLDCYMTYKGIKAFYEK